MSALLVCTAQPSLISIHEIIMTHIIFLVIIMKLTFFTLIMHQALVKWIKNIMLFNLHSIFIVSNLQKGKLNLRKLCRVRA